MYIYIWVWGYQSRAVYWLICFWWWKEWYHLVPSLHNSIREVTSLAFQRRLELKWSIQSNTDFLKWIAKTINLYLRTRNNSLFSVAGGGGRENVFQKALWQSIWLIIKLDETSVININLILPLMDNCEKDNLSHFI